MSHHGRNTSFRISSPLRGEFAGNWLILLTKGQWWGASSFLHQLEHSVEQTLQLRSDELNVYKHTECPNYMVAVLKMTSSDVFPWVKICMIWFYIQWTDFAYIRMNEITNIEDAMISGMVHSVVHIWYDRLGPFDIQDWRKMATEGRWLVWYVGGCVKSCVLVVVCDCLGPFNRRGSRDMADDILEKKNWNTMFS